MDICFISQEYPSEENTGGIATYTAKTAAALAGLGHRVWVITESQGSHGTAIVDDVTVISIARPPRPHLLTRSAAVARTIAHLPRVPDIIQACEYRAEAWVAALDPRLRRRLITRLATPSRLVYELDGETLGLRTNSIDRLERLQAGRSIGIISPTEALADRVSERWSIPRSRITVIRTGVDFRERYANTAEDLPGSLAGREYILYFGRLEERKGVHVLAQALPEVLRARSDLHIAFVGNDCGYRGYSMREYIRSHNRAFEERIHFFDRCAAPALYPIIKGCLFAVLPSLWENLANTCLEALDLGKPVIATSGCGFGEVISDGCNGLLVPPNNVPELAKAMSRLVADRVLLGCLGRGARLSIASFALDRTTEILLDYYRDIAGGASEKPPLREIVGEPR
ncbi:MAG TPA: glycosyltransferase family 4 protein [Chloroflexota bacterium]|nr:glycosyltransferase family 4 protein [Chloroflexota bacterium]